MESPVAVETTLTEEAAAPMPVAEPAPVEAAAVAEVVGKDETSAGKRSTRKPKDASAELVKKPRGGRKGKAEVDTAEPVKRG